MAEWLIEEGIGESRAVLIRDGEICAARLHWPGALSAGLIEDAQLIARTAGSKRGSARFSGGEMALVDHLPRDASEGAVIRLKITRAAISETGRTKFSLARPTEEPPRPAPGLQEALEAQGHSTRIVRRFPVEGWDDIITDGFSRTLAFDGGVILVCPTPAMTLIDIDGPLPPARLALAAVPAIASALRRLDIGGAVGIDFPSLQDKADRRAVDAVLAEALADWPHERTAMNGFGFVQLVARLERPSILHRIAHDPAGAAARTLLRRAEAVSDPGAILLVCHPTIKTALKPEWLARLQERSGREIRLKADPALAPEAGFAQAVPL